MKASPVTRAWRDVRTLKDRLFVVLHNHAHVHAMDNPFPVGVECDANPREFLPAWRCAIPSAPRALPSKSLRRRKFRWFFPQDSKGLSVGLCRAEE